MIYFDKPAKDYFAMPGISKSGLDKIAISPAHYLASIERPQKQTDEFLVGQAVHTLTLEPEKFDAEFVVAPAGMDRRTKEGKAMAVELEQSGKAVITAAQFETIEGMASSVRSHRLADDLLSNGDSEVSFDAIIDGTTVRGRCDFLAQAGHVVDLKTTKSASPGAFARSCADYRYHVQAAIYTDLLTVNDVFVTDFVFVAVEKTYPFAVAVYQLDAFAIERGRELYQRDLAVYRECVATGEWPGYSGELVTLSLPAWA